MLFTTICTVRARYGCPGALAMSPFHRHDLCPTSLPGSSIGVMKPTSSDTASSRFVSSSTSMSAYTPPLIRSTQYRKRSALNAPGVIDSYASRTSGGKCVPRKSAAVSSS